MKALIAWLAATIDTAILVSVVSTQLVLADISGFGLAVPVGDRLAATLHDLIGVGPALAVLVGSSYAVAFPVAHRILRISGGNPVIWFAAAGLLSLPSAIVLIKLAMGGTLLASARTPLGMIAVSLCGLAGGLFYYWLTTVMRRAESDSG